MERSKHNRSRSLSGPCPYVSRDTTEDGCIVVRGISKREKQPYDI